MDLNHTEPQGSTRVAKTQIITGLISVLEELWTSDTLLDINDKDEFLSHVSRGRLRLVILISRGEGKADALRPLLIRLVRNGADKENGEVRSLDTYRSCLRFPNDLFSTVITIIKFSY